MSAIERSPVEQAIDKHKGIYQNTPGNRFESPEYVSSWKDLRSLGLPVWKLEQGIKPQSQEQKNK